MKNKRLVRTKSWRENVRVTQNPKHAVVRVKHIGPGDIVSVEGRRLDFPLMLVRELPIDAVIRVDVMVDANSPLVRSGRRTRRGVEVESAARVLRRRPIISCSKFVRQGVDSSWPACGNHVPRIGIADCASVGTGRQRVRDCRWHPERWAAPGNPRPKKLVVSCAEKSPSQLGGCRHLGTIRASAVEPQSLIVGEKEGFVPLFIDARDIQRAAACETELVAMIVKPWGCGQVIEVEVGVQLRDCACTRPQRNASRVCRPSW